MKYFCVLLSILLAVPSLANDQLPNMGNEGQDVVMVRDIVTDTMTTGSVAKPKMDCAIFDCKNDNIQSNIFNKTNSSP
jgi:hypothetical protein